MRLLFTSDFHGSADHYRMLRLAVETIRPDVLVLGGDMFPDDPAMPPGSMGTHQPRYVAEVFRAWLSPLLKTGACRQVLSIFGNHDWLSAALAMNDLAAANDALKVLTPDHPVEIDGVAFLGYSCTPPTPCYAKDFERRDLPEDHPPLVGGARWDVNRRKALAGGARAQFTQVPTVADELARLSTPGVPWVFVAHAPPHDTVLDQTFQRAHAGSKAIRRFIESTRPMLTLHGHVHESPDVSGQFEQALGPSRCVNVGQRLRDLCYAVVELDARGVQQVRAERGKPR